MNVVQAACTMAMCVPECLRAGATTHHDVVPGSWMLNPVSLPYTVILNISVTSVTWRNRGTWDGVGGGGGACREQHE